MQISRLALWMCLFCAASMVNAATRPLSSYDAFIELIHSNKLKDDWARIHAINNFINRALVYRTDQEQHGRHDHWAGPRESLYRGAGDCEDYALAKFVALRAMGIPDTQLRLVYARLLPSGEAHMVLYYRPIGSSPLVLDNISNHILPANERRDLRTIYSFNESGIWLPGKDAPFLPMTNLRWTLILKEISATILLHNKDTFVNKTP